MTMEQGNSTQAKIQYCSMEDRYLQEVEDLHVDAFFPDEKLFSLSRNCEGGEPEDHRGWIRRAICQHDWGVTRLAIDTDTGRVIGVMLNETADVRGTTALDVMDHGGTEASRLVLSVLQHLGQGYDIYKTLQAEKVLFLNFGMVDRRYRRQGISLELRRQSLELARQQGCQAALDDATSPYTRRALVKLGFQEERFVPHSESPLAACSKVDLSKCEPGEGCALMVRRL